MRKILLFLASAALLLSVFSVSAAGLADDRECHFYICRGKEHAPATTDPAFEEAFGARAVYRDVRAEKAGEKRLYLTFDAGYENGNVEKILDILKEKDVKGAFFVLSHLIESEPLLVARMEREGHLVCNHTAHHKNMARTDEDTFVRELQTLEKAYADATGKSLTKYYRPPEGTFAPQNLAWAEKMGYKTVFWSLAYCDWNDSVAPSPEKAKKLLRDNTHAGAIVLIHPTSAINVRILGDMIDEWRREGYTFHTLHEIF